MTNCKLGSLKHMSQSQKEKVIELVNEENWQSAIKLIDTHLAPDNILFEKESTFEYLFKYFYHQSVWEEVDPSLDSYIRLNIGEANFLNFDVSDKFSFLGSLFHTTIKINVISRLFRKGVSPKNKDGSIYRGFLKPLMDPIVSFEKKRWGLDLLSRKYPNDISPSLLGKVVPDHFLPGQVLSWTWIRDEFVDDLGDIDMYSEKFINDIELLLEFGADINAKSDEESHTGLMRASMNSIPEAVAFLVSKSADTNIQNWMGNTALMYSSGFLPDASPMDEKWEEIPEHLEIAKILVEAGADISIKNDHGDTALDLAKRNKNTALAEYLESLG